MVLFFIFYYFYFLFNLLFVQKIKELMLKLPFYAEKQVIDTPPPTGIVFFVATDIEVHSFMLTLTLI